MVRQKNPVAPEKDKWRLSRTIQSKLPRIADASFHKHTWEKEEGSPLASHQSSIAPVLVARREEMQNCSKRHHQPIHNDHNRCWSPLTAPFLLPKIDISCHLLPGNFISFPFPLIFMDPNIPRFSSEKVSQNKQLKTLTRVLMNKMRLRWAQHHSAVSVSLTDDTREQIHSCRLCRASEVNPP